MKIKKFELFKEKERKYEYGCIFLEVEMEGWKDILNQIPEKDLAEDGYSELSHITLLYGIHETVSMDEIKDIVSTIDTNKFDITVGNLSLFENKEFDVLKLDIYSHYLKELNNKFKKLDHTNDFPDYHAHLTIAYLKVGLGKKYIDIDINKEIKISKITFTNVYGEEVNFEI